MREYAIKVGNSITGTGRANGSPFFSSVADALKEIKLMEIADRAYDIPNPEKRSIVFREVTKWQKWTNPKEVKGLKLPK